jgi:tetratricopeptide (TPR) repeat protein/transcriptional regulator with XRE-family HTH domain
MSQPGIPAFHLKILAGRPAGIPPFRAVELDYGQALIFDGANLLHGSRSNSTAISRVSFDLRFAPRRVQELAPGRRAVGMSKQLQPDFAAVLKLLRHDARLTQEELAEMTGLSARTISDLERGVNGTARKATAGLLADSLGLSGTLRDRFLAAAGGLIPAAAVLAVRTDARTVAGSTENIPTMRYSLPPGTAAFCGRSAEVDRITTAVSGAVGTGAVVAIDGMPGVGKTALAVHIAHQLRDQFPDRQLFIDLHGHTPGLDPVPTAAALAGLLTAAGVDARYLPESLEERAGMWRDRTAGQRALLVLDNAASSSQVGPLLPGDGGWLVLVTSRRHLGDLPGAVTALLLGVLTPHRAAEMFTRLAPRAAASPAEVVEVVRLAGWLPLAISLLARVFARHQSWTLANLITEIRAGLLTLTAENASIAAAFDVSYRHLDLARQEFLSLLGLHPGTTIDGYAAAALAAVSLNDSVRSLDALHGEGLLIETGHRRYGLHDLLRRYVRDLTPSGPAPDRQRARERLLDYYQFTAARAEAQLARQTRPGPTAPLPAWLRAIPPLNDASQGLAWARTERASLLACLDHATHGGHHARVIALTAGLAALFRHDGSWAEAVTRHSAAVSAAQRLGDRLGEANALDDLGDVRWRTGDYPNAIDVFGRALDIYRDLGDQLGEANALSNIGVVRHLTGDFPGATQALEQALDIYRSLGNRLGEAKSLTFLGDVLRMTGDHPAAVQALQQAMSSYRELGNQRGEANALDYLGSVWLRMGEYPRAVLTLKQALDIYRELGDRRGEANALNHLGMARRMTGDYPNATHVLKQALDIYRELGDRLGEANALDDLGIVRRMTGDYPYATQALEQALDIYHELGIRAGEVEVLNEMGAVYRVSGDIEQAEKRHQQALTLARSIGNSWDKAHALAGLGRCAVAVGRVTEAEKLLRQAQEIFQQLGTAEAQTVLGELSALTEPRRAQ